MRGTAIIVLGLLAACGKVSDEGGPCDTDGQCLPGFTCVEKYCTFLDRRSGPTPWVGPEGGIVEGADGVELIVPQRSLTATTTIVIRRASSALEPTGLELLLHAYEMKPDPTFLRAVTVRIPVDPALGVEADEVAVWNAEDPTGMWSRLEGESTATLGVGRATHLRLFGAARQRP